MRGYRWGLGGAEIDLTLYALCRNVIKRERDIGLRNVYSRSLVYAMIARPHL